MRKNWFQFLIAVMCVAALWGCGSSGGSGGSSVTDDSLGEDSAGNAYVGASECASCHETFSWSADKVSAYLEGPHVIHSDHINGASEAACLECHDPVGDGDGIAEYIDAADVPEDGLAVVGCENCHGGGGEHFGVGPIPTPTPDATACQQCHDDQWNATDFVSPAHITYHPEGNNIYTDWEASAHNNIHDGTVCAKCHTDEGARMFKLADTVAALEAISTEIEDPSPIQCRTCHDPHNPNELLEAEVTTRSGTVTTSAEYATCTNCHQRHDAQISLDEAGTVAITTLAGSTSTDGASGDLIYHAARYTRVISSTHYDNPDTANMIEGYVVDPANERACRDCHNVHSADITINEQWAESGHGGELLEAKNQYVIDNGGEVDEEGEVDDHSLVNVSLYRAGGDSSSAWSHYDWDAGDRQSCQMCHTATGYKNYVADPENYDPANNDFSHLSGWSVDAEGTVTSSGQNELLFCSACHSNNAGALRQSGAVTAVYTYNEEPIVFPDVGSSNTCVVCHSGRGNNETASDSSRFAGHHAPAAADLFSEYSHVAYEYPDLDYSNVSYFAHDSIAADDQGPCVACHMNGEATNHTFAVVEKDDSGVITAIKADVCVTCHSGGHGYAFVSEDTTNDNGTFTVAGAAAALEEESEGYQEAGDILLALVANTITNYQGAVVDEDSTVENDRGAFQNSKLPSDEPGGFAHNRYYVKRAIFDAIDWLEDGEINGTIADYSATYPEGASWLGSARP